MAAVNGASGDQLPVPLSIISSRILTGLKSSPIATGIAIIHIVLTFSSFYFQKLAQALELNPSGILSQLSVWNFLTYILIEQDFFLLILNALFVLNAGSKLESVFSATLLQFTLFVTVCSGISTFLLVCLLYIFTGGSIDLFVPICGLSGISAAISVGLKHQFPENQILNIFPKVRVKHVPFLFFVSSFILAVLSNLAVFWRAFYLVTFSVTYAWIYIRYFRVNPNSSILGDDSAEFSFMTIFPEPIQPVFKVIELFLANICKLGRRNFQQRANHLNPTEDNVSVDMVGDDPTAERRKALAIKIINDKLAEKRNKQESAVPFSKAEN